MWYAIIDKTTGECVSTGTVIADPMPKEYEVVELGEDFVQEGKWDNVAREFKPREKPTPSPKIQSLLDELKVELEKETDAVTPA